jgi:dolichol-phosphate mannosyltransferase
VVVPTYNEVDNIRPLCERLFKACKAAGLEVDLLVMDDESKGTPRTEEIVKELQKEGFAIKIHVRRKGEGRGLSSAVLLGFEKAKHETMCCMDADLQHEPEAVPSVAYPVLSGNVDFSIGSRHVDGGGLGSSGRGTVS